MNTAAVGVLLCLQCAILEGLGQISLKKSAVGGRVPWALVGIALFALHLALYVTALRYLEVSTAFPIMSLSFVTVILLSRFVLGETVTTMRWVGVGLIVFGTILLALQA